MQVDGLDPLGQACLFLVNQQLAPSYVIQVLPQKLRGIQLALPTNSGCEFRGRHRATSVLVANLIASPVLLTLPRVGYPFTPLLPALSPAAT